MAIGFGALAIVVMIVAAVVMLIWRHEFRNLEFRAQERDDKVAELGRTIDGAERRAKESEARAAEATAKLDGVRTELDTERRARAEEIERIGKEASSLKERLAASEQDLKRMTEESAGSLRPSGVPKLTQRSLGDPSLAPGTAIRRTAEIDAVLRGPVTVDKTAVQGRADEAIGKSGLPLSDSSFLAQVDVRINANVDRMLKGDSYGAAIVVMLLQPTVSPALDELRWTATITESDIVQGADQAELDQRLEERTRQLVEGVLQRASQPPAAPANPPAAPP